MGILAVVALQLYYVVKSVMQKRRHLRALDDVKKMNQMMLYAKCVTIRDAQLLAQLGEALPHVVRHYRRRSAALRRRWVRYGRLRARLRRSGGFSWALICVSPSGAVGM